MDLVCFALVPCSNPQYPNNPTETPPDSCPRDALKLGVCANFLGGMFGAVIGTPPVTPCCIVLGGLMNMEAAVCLCTIIRANIMGISLYIPVSITMLLNVCGIPPPAGFICAVEPIIPSPSPPTHSQ
ncbi:unnamed protein product [Ilex paraguariensis]|uniref:Bifunctional inhibitor/plant lipid transfer protein/seed storage helical domain-containing protein n=1 Tax=Ilex paraguariensis TaxID=185542 RepID=A0ABC8UKN5_9AQUA